MADFFDQYEAANALKQNQRKRFIRVLVAGFAALALGVTGYFYFRTWSEERVVNEFFASLDRKDFQGAYRMWGCSQEKPCDNYDPKRFNEDWGPDTPYSKVSTATLDQVDFCGEGVVVRINYPKAEAVSLWVDRSTKLLSFAPWPRCPGKHLEFGRLLSRLFNRS